MSYVIFAGDNYYPLGGWDDYYTEILELDGAKDAAKMVSMGRCDWAHVVDAESGEVIARFERGKESAVAAGGGEEQA